jgi:DNA (cytosine-5)-methyltransferase 1
MRYVSVCAGIEAATVAWHHLGWTPVAFSEIEPFPSAVLAHHYPNVPNLEDMTKFEKWNLETVELLVGGTPCQSFSVAGLRKGLTDPRGGLMLTYLGIARRYRPRWIVWENVPGVLSSNGGRDFGSFLGALGELGYGFAYRVLDAQWFGVAQRRRRVFVVGYLGDWRRAAQVLFERESVRRDTAPSREARQNAAGAIAARFRNSRNYLKEIAPTLCAQDTRWGSNQWVDQGEAVVQPVAQCLTSVQRFDPTVETPITVVQPVAQSCGAFLAGQGAKARSIAYDESVAPTLKTSGSAPSVHVGMQVRRLTPRECERLQGFPDDYTLIAWAKKPTSECPDGPRYKALGNSMAVPVMRWIGERIEREEAQ